MSRQVLISFVALNVAEMLILPFLKLCETEIHGAKAKAHEANLLCVLGSDHCVVH